MSIVWSKYRVAITLIGLIVLGFVGCFVLYTRRIDHPVVYYYGASPEVPGGTAIAVLNPFRSREDEANAEWLFRDLRTSKCEQIVRERLRADPGQICPVFRNNTRASLIWFEAKRDHRTGMPFRTLIYDLPESKARLLVYFSTDEVGWGLSTVSLLR